MHLNTSTVNVPAMFQDAMTLHQQGRFEEAQLLYENVLRVDPSNADAWHLSGLIYLQRQEFEASASRVGEAIKLNPSNPAYYVNHGIALKGNGQLDAALLSYDLAIALEPKFAAAHYSRGNVLSELKEFEAAVASFDRTIALQPGDPLAYMNRGSALRSLKQYASAVDSFDRVIAIQPNNADAHFSRGTALYGADRLSEAIESYDQAIALNPNHAQAHFNRGIALKAMQKNDAALISYEQAIATDPNYAEAYYNRGLLLQDQKKFDLAIASFERACSIQPSYFEAHLGCALAQSACNQLDSAVATCERAIAIQPESAEAHWCKSLALLLGGQLDRGWELYEWRWRLKISTENRSFQEPMWTGLQSLQGKSIYIHHEQGFGDALQFCRYAKLLAARGARVIMEVPPHLMGVLKTLHGVSELIAIRSTAPVFDYQCALLSLPMAFKTTIDNIPAEDSYLRSDEQLVSHWNQILGPKTKTRVGVVWCGNPTHQNDHNRSIALSTLLEGIPDSVEVVSLQKEVRDIDHAVLECHSHVRHFGEALRDFSDTAALCSLMDVVVSVDTSVAHLSAALGKPTWILLPFNPDWRWLLDREDSPWYPSVKLYRQHALGDWEQVREKLQHDLQKISASIDKA